MDDGTKIARFSPEEPKENNPATDQLVLDLIQREKDNGNIEKAHQLAERLAAEAGSNEEEYLVDERLPEEIYHRRMLMIFSIISSIEVFCPNGFIAGISKNRFYEIITEMPGVTYDAKDGNTIFSFYYLCLRDAEAPDRCIGLTFAKLCGHENNKIYCELGENLYRFFARLVSDCVTELQFATE